MKRKFGFITGQNQLEEETAYAAEHSFDHIEIDLLKEDTQMESFDRKRIHELKKITFEREISLSLHVPYTLNLIRKGKISRRKLIGQMRHTFDLAADLNATHITSHIGSFSRQVMWADPREESLKRAIESISLICEIAQSHHIPFAFENLVPLHPQSAYHFIGDNIGDFEAIFSCVDTDFCRFCLDIGHANLNEGSEAYIRKFRDRILCVHYHDNDGKKDLHLEVGEGNILWKRIIGALDESGFKGPYVSECFESLPHITRAKLLELTV